MESPDTWTPAVKLINEELVQYLDGIQGRVLGASFGRTLYNALVTNDEAMRDLVAEWGAHKVR